jgi:hypothetical protein
VCSEAGRLARSTRATHRAGQYAGERDLPGSLGQCPCFVFSKHC